MGSIDNEQYGLLRYTAPDHSMKPEEHCLFSPPRNTQVKDEHTKLHDARTSENIFQGMKGLDSQGFAYVKHPSVVADEYSWSEGTKIEDVYFPEVNKLICDTTGAKKAIVIDCAMRRRLADKQTDPDFYLSAGCDLENEIKKLPRDVALVYGKDAAGSLEPARGVHIDYTLKGLRSVARNRRKEITALAKKTLDAEDALDRGEDVEVPRYAAYSVWRPLKTVKRDPLAVCDTRTIDPSDLDSAEYRAFSDINENQECLLDAGVILPPKDPERLKWYWMPQQEPDEALIIKFADTQSEKDPNVSFGCAHASPAIPDTENEEPRESIECRVLAFWE